MYRIAALAFFFSLFCAISNAAEQDKTVRAIYLVSKNREVRADYKEAIEKAIIDVRSWYEKHLDGVTFKLHDPIVEVPKSDQDAAWFYANPNGKNKDDWGYNNAFAEVKRLLGAKFFDPNYVWVIYSDGPGDKGRGGSSVTVLPENDLTGLIGQHKEMPKVARWIGGLAHELGHAFGLPHPPDTKKDYDAIMWAGFYEKYPLGSYFTATDKATLLQSPFFFDASGQPAIATARYEEKYGHERGFFGKTGGKWIELSQDTSAIYRFDELVRDTNAIFIKDPSRGYTIKIPINGGMSELTGDDGFKWQNLYQLKKE